MSRVGWLGAIVAAALVALAATAAPGRVLAQDSADDATTKPQRMVKDADPDWEVATVRPSDPSGTDGGFQRNGRELDIRRKTVEQMLLFGYGVIRKQVVNAPDWIRSEVWDAKGFADLPGQPSLQQYQSLTRKLLTERFGLVAHSEQRQMDVYALTVGKGGEKMTPSTSDPKGRPTENDSYNGGQRTMQMENASMSDLTLQLKFFMDRPVVDHTNLNGRYDFSLKWTEDESKAPTDGTAAPSLFTAIQERLGLKLEPVKAPADVLVIDQVEKPSPN